MPSLHKVLQGVDPEEALTIAQQGTKPSTDTEIHSEALGDYIDSQNPESADHALEIINGMEAAIKSMRAQVMMNLIAASFPEGFLDLPFDNREEFVGTFLAFIANKTTLHTNIILTRDFDGNAPFSLPLQISVSGVDVSLVEKTITPHEGESTTSLQMIVSR